MASSQNTSNWLFFPTASEVKNTFIGQLLAVERPKLANLRCSQNQPPAADLVVALGRNERSRQPSCGLRLTCFDKRFKQTRAGDHRFSKQSANLLHFITRCIRCKVKNSTMRLWAPRDEGAVAVKIDATIISAVLDLASDILTIGLWFLAPRCYQLDRLAGVCYLFRCEFHRAS